MEKIRCAIACVQFLNTFTVSSTLQYFYRFRKVSLDVGTDFSVFLILSEIQILRDHKACVQYEATCLLNSFLRIG